ncbi:MAG: hypothetical protein QG628_256 [Patescibacteria group bacterium]|nr:hypothetical protein [Patescibacteria group bacterium]
MNNDKPETVSNNQPAVEEKPVNPVQKTASPEISNINDITTWPGAFGAYKYSKKAVRTNANTIVILIILSIVWAIINSIEIQNKGVSLLKDIVDALVNVIFTAAFITILLAGVNNVKLSVSQVMSKIKQYLLNIFIVSVLVSFATIASIILFVIPFFFVFPRLVFAPYLVIDKGLSATEAFSASWKMSKGHVGKVYGIVGANIAMGLLAITIIGIPFAIYFVIMYSAATAILYSFINKQQPEVSSPPTAQQNTNDVSDETKTPEQSAPIETAQTAPTIPAEAPAAPTPPTTPAATPAESTAPSVPTDTPSAPKV